MANYLTFSEIITETERAVKQYQSSMQSLVKSVINQVYLNEVLQCDNLYPLHWLQAPLMNRLHAPKTITGITQAAEGVITSAGHEFISGEVIAIFDIEGMTEINYDYNAFVSNLKLYVVSDTDLAANTFKVEDLWGSLIDTSGYSVYTTGGTILHYGWTIVGSITGLIKSVSDIGIHDSLPLTPIGWKEIFESPDTYFQNSSCTPYRYMHYFTVSSTGTVYNYALTFPGNQERKIAYIMIEVAGERLSAGTDVPLLPPQFHDTIISGAITRLAENQVQVENQVVWPSIYRNQIEAIKTYNRNWWKQHEQGMDKPYLL